MKKIVLLAVLLSFSMKSFAQSKENKWVLGVSASFVSFGEEGKTAGFEQFNIQVPKINITRYLFAGFSLEAGATFSVIDKLEGFYTNEFSYMSLDGNLRYDFNRSRENLVPYIGVGASIIGAPTDVLPGAKMSPTLNFTFGGTFWISPHWGINAQATYKYSSEEIQSMLTHNQFSAGVVYSFSPKQMVYRIWE